MNSIKIRDFTSSNFSRVSVIFASLGNIEEAKIDDGGGPESFMVGMALILQRFQSSIFISDNSFVSQSWN